MANRYILFYKPYDVLSTFTDPEGRQTLGTYVTAPGVYAAGRLDQDSEGLMLLTDDGRLAHVLTDPDHKLPKTYFVQIENEPDKAAISQLRRGVMIKGEMTLPAEVDLLDDEPDLPERSVPIRYRPSIPTRWLRIVLREGRKRQIRHMTAAVGHPTLRLVRVAIGPLTLRGLQPGQWRDLTPEELEALRNALGLNRPARPTAEAEGRRSEAPRTPSAGPRRPPPGGPRGQRQEAPRGRNAGEQGPREERGVRPERGGPARPARSSGTGRWEDRSRPPRRGEDEPAGPRRTGGPGYDEERPAGPRAGRGPQPPRDAERDTGRGGGARGSARPPSRQGPRREGSRPPGDRGPKQSGQRSQGGQRSDGAPQRDERPPRTGGQPDRRPRREERPEPQRQERRPEPRREERSEPRPERRPEPAQPPRTRTRPPGTSRSIGQRPKRRTS